VNFHSSNNRGNLRVSFDDLNNTDKRRNPNGNQHYGIKELWNHHHEISRLLLLGYNNKKIASALGLTPQTISNVRNSPQMKRKLFLMSSARDNDAIEVADRIKALAPKAVRVFEEVMETALEDDAFVTDKDLRRDAITSAKIVTDHAHPKEVKGEHIVGFVTMEQVREAKKRAIEGGAFAGDKIEDADFKEIKREVKDEEDDSNGSNGNGDSAVSDVDKLESDV